MKVIVIISGLTQKMHQNTGSRQLWRELRKRAYLHAESDVIVELKEWNTDWKSYAKYINSFSPSEVFVCCYSWGGGFGMPQLSKRLQCDVSAVACDPVYHSTSVWGMWRSLFSRSIRLCKNVSVVGWLSQCGDWIDGDPLVGGNSICREQTYDYAHTEIDNSREYHNLAVDKAMNYLLK